MWAYAVIGFSIGFIIGWFVVYRGRKPFEHDVEAIGWVERPVPVWLQSKTQAIYIYSHAFGVLFLAVLFLLHACQVSNLTGFSPFVGRMLLVVWIVAGSVLSFPIAYRNAGKMPMFVFLDAFARGQYVGDWGCFSRFQGDPSKRIIWLYGALTPEIVRVAWQPTTDEIYSKVVDLLDTVQLRDVPPGTAPWYRKPAAFISLLMTGMVPLLIAGILVYQYGVAWSWLYYVLAVLLLVVMGNLTVRLYQLD